MRSLCGWDVCKTLWFGVCQPCREAGSGVPLIMPLIVHCSGSTYRYWRKYHRKQFSNASSRGFQSNPLSDNVGASTGASNKKPALQEQKAQILLARSVSSALLERPALVPRRSATIVTRASTETSPKYLHVKIVPQACIRIWRCSLLH